MPLLFGNKISTITGEPEPEVESKVFVAKAITDALRSSAKYIQGNLFPPEGKNMHPGMKQSIGHRNPAQWIDRSRPDYQPSLFAAPQVNMSLSQSSGAWKKPFKIFFSFLKDNPGAMIDDVVKKTSLSKYEAENIMNLLKANRR